MLTSRGVLCLALGAVLVAASGCAQRTMQMRLAKPLMPPGNTASAPVMYFEKLHGPGRETAHFVEATAGDPFVNRVNLRPNAAYHVTLVLPADYEQTRLSMLRQREQQLAQAISAAETRLRENTSREARLLSHAARAKLIQDAADLRVQMDQTKVTTVGTSPNYMRISADQQSDTLAAQLESREALLRQDDEVRDSLLPQPVVEQLLDQIQGLRAELGDVKADIVGMEIMTVNAADAMPRIISGVVETEEPTTFTRAGTIPLEIDDQYIDWIRQGKVVTIVSFDPNEIPADDESAARRALLPEEWPEFDLLVVERAAVVSGVPRLAAGGTATNAQILEMRYPGSAARTYYDPANGYRTYVSSADGTRVWVFGPDVTPPANVEVWAGSGSTAIKLYPPDERTVPTHAYVRQIAGVEGGVFDPIREAEKRGRVLAITRLGNLHRGDAGAKVFAAGR